LPRKHHYFIFRCNRAEDDLLVSSNHKRWSLFRTRKIILL
jgi:hypothetical protein